ncbi:MAG: DUF4271 domain-containing protein [Salinivirgaceae bacterium]|nr:DUF4271 domain-containing protein [Salinivirgaceae bacterium]
MNYTFQNGSQADSVSSQIAAPTINTDLFRTFDFNGADAFRVDSSRIAAKPVAPIIKTVPYVPENDTITHPEYDVLTGEFVIQHDNSLASQLRLNPIAPDTTLRPVSMPIEQTQVAAAPQHSAPDTVSSIVVPARQTQVLEDAGTPILAETDATPADTVAIVAENAADTLTALSDTTIVATDTITTVQAGTHLFTEKEGKPINRKLNNFSVNRNVGETDWMIGVIIASFVLFIWARMIYGKFIGMVMQSVMSAFTARRVYSETNAVRNRIYFILNIIFYINTSLLLCQSFEFYGFKVFDDSSFMHFLVCFGAIVVFFLLRTIVLKTIDFLFETKAFGEYNFTIYLFNKAFGLLVLPVVTVIPFVPSFVAEKLIWAGFALLALSYLLTLFRGLRICLKNRVSIFYLFFYLCALEILPITTLCKLVIDYCL